jgi:hypothetical protein
MKSKQPQKSKAAFAAYLELAPTGAGAAYAKKQLRWL